MNVGKEAQKINDTINLSNDQLKDYVHKKMKPRVRFSERPLLYQLVKKRSDIPPPPPSDVLTSPEQPAETERASPSTSESSNSDYGPTIPSTSTKERIKRAKTKVANGVPPHKIKKGTAPIPASPVSPVLIQRKARMTQSPKSTTALFQPGNRSFE